MTKEEITDWLDKNKEFNFDDGYEQCTQEVFDEIKQKCIYTWTDSGWFDDEDYINEKIERIEAIQNFNADVIFMLNMFHPIIRTNIIHQLSKKAQEYIDRYNKIAYDN
jgi:hypothetical protein